MVISALRVFFVAGAIACYILRYSLCQDEGGSAGGKVGLSKIVGTQQNWNPKKRRGKKRSSRSSCGGALEEMDFGDTGWCRLACAVVGSQVRL